MILISIGTNLVTSSSSLPLYTHYTYIHINSDDAIAAIRGGEEQLAVLRRQALIGNLYPSGSSVMDSP